MAPLIETVRLLDRRTIRGIARALRRDARRYDPPSTPDPSLVECVDRPYESAAAVTDQLSRLERRLRAQGDRRAVFLTIYARMTRTVREWIDDGRFVDPDWMRRYLLAFANYYRRAFLAFERAEIDAVPEPWLIAFDAALRADALVVQDALLGVNAHINYDLALAITDVGIDPNRARKYADHRVIDGILSRLVDAQQDALVELYGSVIDVIDAPLGRLDESLLLGSMTAGREQAWRLAVVLTDSRFPPLTAAARWLLRATATGGGRVVRSPRLDPALGTALRDAEANRLDVATVLDRVDEHLDSVQL
jgi:hypothetical protein